MSSCAAANVENPAAASANTAKPVIDRRMAVPRFGCRAAFPIMAPSSTTHYEYAFTRDPSSSCPQLRSSDPLAWRGIAAPSLADFETIAPEVYRNLPKTFRDLCEDLVIRIDDFPTDEVLDEMQLESPFDLLGLFQGVGLPFRSESAPLQMPNMIWLYRRPILDYWSEHEDTLGAVIAHVLVHEIGHHFGLSDDDMEAIEAQAS